MTTQHAGSESHDRDDDVRDHFDRMTRRYLRSVLSEALIEEHRRCPAHPSEPLAEVLAWCQRRPVTERYAVKAEDDGSFRLVRFSGRRGEGPRSVAEERYPTLEEARHGAFLLHIRDLTG